MPVAHAKGGERGPQPGDPFFELAIGKALVCVDDLLIGRAPGSRQQQLADGERIVMRARSPRGDVTGHVERLSFAVPETQRMQAARGRPSLRRLDPGRIVDTRFPLMLVVRPALDALPHT